MARLQGISREAVKESLLQAVHRVYELDGVLLKELTHERSVMFHVGRHLAAEVDGWGDPWRVDLEYNRFHEHTVDAVKKFLPATSGRDAGGVFPDLILHDRSESSEDANVLVVEAKCTPSALEREREYAKLKGYMDVLHYRTAVFLEFRSNGLVPCWAVADSDNLTGFSNPTHSPPEMWTWPLASNRIPRP